VARSSETKTKLPFFAPPSPPEPSDTFDCDVLIVGAGTSGLALANELGARNIKSIVVESRLDCISDARFLVLNAATMEGLHTLGMDATLLESTLERGINQDQPFGSTWIDGGLLNKSSNLVCASNVPGRTEMTKMRPNMTLEATSRSMGSR